LYKAIQDESAKLHVLCNSNCMSARAIRQILASSLRAADPRASANIVMHSPCTNVLNILLDDHHCQNIVLALQSMPYSII